MELRISGNSIQEGIPTPESSVDIQNVTGNANVTICNKNLFDKNKIIENSYVKATNGEINPLNDCFSTDFIKIKENTTYKWNDDIRGNNGAIYDINKEYIEGISNKTTFITPSGAYYVRMTGDTSKIDLYQFEENSIKTDYEEHKEQSFTFPLAEGQRLMKGDYLSDDGIHHKRKQIVLDGTENWLLDGTMYKILVSDMKVANVGVGISNYYVNFNVYDNSKSRIRFGWLNNYIFIYDLVHTSLEEFRTFLSEQYANGTPVTVEYELVEEEIEAYTEEQQAVYDEIKKTAHSYKNITHIFSTDEISPIFDVTYSKDLETILNNMQAQILAE